jgi:RNA polymerase-binding transcription factor DksA
MGKHLSIKEKLNAENELIQNRNEVLELRKELKIITDTARREELIARWQDLKKRNKKLSTHIKDSKKSVHKGKYGINGICYNMFCKKI